MIEFCSQIQKIFNKNPNNKDHNKLTILVNKIKKVDLRNIFPSLLNKSQLHQVQLIMKYFLQKVLNNQTFYKK